MTRRVLSTKDILDHLDDISDEDLSGGSDGDDDWRPELEPEPESDDSSQEEAIEISARDPDAPSGSVGNETEAETIAESIRIPPAVLVTENASSSHGSCPLVFDAEEQVIEVVVVSSTSKETNLTRKRKRAAGEEYSSQKTNKTVEKRQWKKITCKCRFFSCRSISEEEIQKSFSDYWELGRLHGNMHTQKQFILQHVVKRSTKRKMGETNRRTSTFDYFLTVTGEKKRVCKAFFLGALGLGEKFVRNCVMNTSGAGTASSDKRAETSPQNFKKKGNSRTN